MTFIFPRGWVSGLTLSAAGGTGTFGISVGQATDSTNAIISNFAPLSAFTKTTSAWSAGSGNGGLDTGSISSNTWYHVHIVDNPTTPGPDILFSLSPTAPTLPAAFTTKRRIGSMKTDGSNNWFGFIQNGDRFTWNAPFVDANEVSLSTSRLLQTVTVPTGVVVEAAVQVFGTVTGGPGDIWVGAVSTTDAAISLSTAPGVTIPTNASVSLLPGPFMHIPTNTSAQIAARANSTSGLLSVYTAGWVDYRGKDM